MSTAAFRSLRAARRVSGPLFCLALSVPLSVVRAQGNAVTSPGPLRAVPFQSVRIRDPFFAPRIETNHRVTLAANLDKCEETGRIRNFGVTAGLVDGEHEGLRFNDSDLYKVLEGVAYTLRGRSDAALEKRADEIIAWIAAAQGEDGYLNTYYTLVHPEQRWTNIAHGHELYCAGHLIEAAVAYEQATGKRVLLDVAVRFADLIEREFGPEGRLDPPGHQELELQLDQAAAYPFMKPVFGPGVVFDATPEQRKQAMRNQSLRDKMMRGHAEVIADRGGAHDRRTGARAGRSMCSSSSPNSRSTRRARASSVGVEFRERDRPRATFRSLQGSRARHGRHRVRQSRTCPCPSSADATSARKQLVSLLEGDLPTGGTATDRRLPMTCSTCSISSKDRQRRATLQRRADHRDVHLDDVRGSPHEQSGSASWTSSSC